MAAGRGEFFRNFLEGLERKSAQPTPTIGHHNGGGEKPGPGVGATGPNTEQTVGRGEKTRPKAQHDSFSPRPPVLSADFHKTNSSLSEENFLERLPSEILIKILSYLDVASLFCLSYVSKLLHRFANDDIIWQQIYLSEFESKMWKLELSDDAGDHPPGRWKKMYFRAIDGQQTKMWKNYLKNINPYNGLPRQTEWVLRNMNVSWELRLCDHLGGKSTLVPSRVRFFESSVTVCWSRASFVQYHHISSIQLYGFRKESPKGPNVRKPPWRSLIFKINIKESPYRFFCKDRLIKVLCFPPGVLVGIWRADHKVAFIMVTLHFHKLVQKSLLGSPACPYAEPLDPPPVDVSDPEFGLHGYTLHFVLHNTSALLMSGQFHQLACHRFPIQRGLVELKVISSTSLSQHRSLSGCIKLPWKSDKLEGSIENCCIMTLTLLDVFHKPFWCVSSPISITMEASATPSDYSGDHFRMDHWSADGRVKMRLVWLKELKQFFLISLTIYVPVSKVNKYFSRHY